MRIRVDLLVLVVPCGLVAFGLPTGALASQARATVAQRPPLAASAGTIWYSRTGGSGDGTIWRAQADGSGDNKVTTGDDARLSPSGATLLFHKGGGTSNFARANIWSRALATGLESEIYPNNDYVVSFSWTPDGKHIVFDYECGIYRMDPGGKNILDLLQQANCYDDAPQVSPTGTEFAFHDEFFGIGLARIDGSGRAFIPNTVPGDLWPTWSPDGKWISFIRTGNSSQTAANMYKIRPDGTGLTPLTTLTGKGVSFEGLSPWTADMKHLVVAGSVRGVQSIWVVPTAGGPPQGPVAVSAGAAPYFVGSLAARPTLKSVTKSAGARGKQLGVTLTGSNLELNAIVSVPPKSGITVSGVRWSTPTTMKASFVISKTAKLGSVDVTIVDPLGGRASCKCFSVTSN
jgi:hypothetical protein